MPPFGCSPHRSSQRRKEFGNAIGTLPRRAQDVGFPDPHYHPARTFEGAVGFAIPRHVPPHFGDPVAPVVSSGKLPNPILQVASVPEVAVAEDHDAMPREHDVRAARQPGNMKPVAKAATPQLTA